LTSHLPDEKKCSVSKTFGVASATGFADDVPDFEEEDTNGEMLKKMVDWTTDKTFKESRPRI